MTPLYREIHRWKALPFIWGETDCIMVLGDWVQTVRGVDPFKEKRKTYDSRGSCHRETGYFRDPVAVLDFYLSEAGIERTDNPAVGDIGVLMAREPDGRLSPCGALWLGDCWAARCPGANGFTISPKSAPDAMATWSVGYET